MSQVAVIRRAAGTYYSPVSLLDKLRADQDVLDVGVPVLPKSDAIMLAILTRQTRGWGRETVTMRVTELAALCGMSRRTAFRTQARLARAGYINYSTDYRNGVKYQVMTDSKLKISKREKLARSAKMAPQECQDGTALSKSVNSLTSETISRTVASPAALRATNSDVGVVQVINTAAKRIPAHDAAKVRASRERLTPGALEHTWLRAHLDCKLPVPVGLKSFRSAASLKAIAKNFPGAISSPASLHDFLYWVVQNWGMLMTSAFSWMGTTPLHPRIDMLGRHLDKFVEAARGPQPASVVPGRPAWYDHPRRNEIARLIAKGRMDEAQEIIDGR